MERKMENLPNCICPVEKLPAVLKENIFSNEAKQKRQLQRVKKKQRNHNKKKDFPYGDALGPDKTWLDGDFCPTGCHL